MVFQAVTGELLIDYSCESVGRSLKSDADTRRGYLEVRDQVFKIMKFWGLG